MKRLVWAMAGVMLLSACSSGVSLTETPKDEQTGLPPGQGIHITTGGADSSAAGQSTVQGVSLNNTVRETAPASSNRVVYFDFDSFVIRPEFQLLIESHAKYLRQTVADKSPSKAIPMNAVGASTTSPSVKSVPKPCAGR